MQAFDAEGESLFDDVEERHRLIFDFGELDGMANKWTVCPLHYEPWPMP